MNRINKPNALLLRNMIDSIYHDAHRNAGDTAAMLIGDNPPQTLIPITHNAIKHFCTNLAYAIAVPDEEAKAPH